jgi:threonine dehydratase
VAAAAERVGAFAVETPLKPSVWLSGEPYRRAMLKLESQQVSGSFKFRGAINKALAARSRGTQTLCTASTGNHGIALAHACALTGLVCVVALPRATGGALLSYFEGLGAKVDLVEGDILSAELASRALHDPRAGVEFASPYNDVEVIAGHSTLAVEVVRQVGAVDAIHLVCSTGGGGLAAGLKLGLRSVGARGFVHSVAPTASPVLARGVRRGWLIEEDIQPTICYGTAGNVELDSITLGLCAELVDSWTEVDEADIQGALEGARREDDLDIDGSAGAAIAGSAAVKAAAGPNEVLVTIICGTNRNI